MSPNQRRLLNIAVFLLVCLAIIWCFGCGLQAPKSDYKLGYIWIYNVSSEAEIARIDYTSDSVPYVCPLWEGPSLIAYIGDNGKYVYETWDTVLPGTGFSRAIRVEPSRIWIVYSDSRVVSLEIPFDDWDDVSVVVNDATAYCVDYRVCRKR